MSIQILRNSIEHGFKPSPRQIKDAMVEVAKLEAELEIISRVEPIMQGDIASGPVEQIRQIKAGALAALSSGGAGQAAPQTIEEKIAALEQEFGADVVQDVIAAKIKQRQIENGTAGALWVRMGLLTAEELKEMRSLGVQSLDEYRRTHPRQPEEKEEAR